MLILRSVMIVLLSGRKTLLSIINEQGEGRKEQRAKSKEQSAKRKAQRAKGKGQRAKRKGQSAKRKAQSAKRKGKAKYFINSPGACCMFVL